MTRFRETVRTENPARARCALSVGMTLFNYPRTISNTPVWLPGSSGVGWKSMVTAA